MTRTMTPGQIRDGFRLALTRLEQIENPRFGDRLATDVVRTTLHQLEGDSAVDWRVLGGVIPGPIPVEWVRVGDTIQDHGVKGTVSRIVRNGNMRHVYIDSGHVCFAKVAQQDFVHVTGTNHADRTRPHETQDTASDEGWVEG